MQHYMWPVLVYSVCSLQCWWAHVQEFFSNIEGGLIKNLQSGALEKSAKWGIKL